MGAPRIYHPTPLAGCREVRLAPAAARHVARVLRLRSGAPVLLFDGRGGEYAARIAGVQGPEVRVRIESHAETERESPLRIVLGQALARGERMDFAIQKAVELGAAAIQPLATARCVVRLKGERETRRREHWQAVAAGACEQCGRNTVPAVHAPIELGEWLARGQGQAGLVLDPLGGEALTALPPPAGELRLLIGPEGGLTEDELAAARKAGFRAVRLGPRVLRAETAPVAAIAALQVLWGDLNR